MMTSNHNVWQPSKVDKSWNKNMADACQHPDDLGQGADRTFLRKDIR